MWPAKATPYHRQCTTYQAEHGVADDMALTQAQRVRDSRGAPEFVFNPRMGETYQEANRITTPSPTGARPKRGSGTI